MIKIVLTEDNNQLAKSIADKLALFKDSVQLKYRARNGEELIGQLSDDHNIDVILMDIEMPILDGIDATKIINQKYPNIKILMLTVFDDEEKIFNAIQAGAMGYLLKDEKPAKLFEAIELIVNGGAPMSPSIAAKSLKLLRNPIIKPSADSKDFNLSEREIEVLEQIAKGLDYKKIAENLFISSSTVRKHIENIYKKLQVHNKVSAINKAIKNKLI